MGDREPTSKGPCGAETPVSERYQVGQKQLAGQEGMSEILLNWGVLDQMETGCRNMETL